MLFLNEKYETSYLLVLFCSVTTFVIFKGICQWLSNNFSYDDFWEMFVNVAEVSLSIPEHF